MPPLCGFYTTLSWDDGYQNDSPSGLGCLLNFLPSLFLIQKKLGLNAVYLFVEAKLADYLVGKSLGDRVKWQCKNS